MDSNGNLAWLERTNDTSWALVSLAPDGRLRFRRPFIVSPTSEGALLVAGRERLFVIHSEVTVSAYHPADGSVLWEQDLARSSPLRFEYLSYEAGLSQTGPLLLLVDEEAQSLWQRALVALDPETGAFLWRRFILAAQGLVISEDGSAQLLAVRSSPSGACCGSHALLSFAPDGTLTGDMLIPSMCSGWWDGVDQPQATLAGTVLTWRYVYVPSRQQVSPTLPFSFFGGHAVLSGTRGVAVGPPGDACAWPRVGSLVTWYPKETPVQLTGFSWPGATLRFQLPLPEVDIVSELQLTARDSVLFAQDTDAGSSLHEVSLDGAEGLLCPLPAGAHASLWKSSLAPPTLVGLAGFWVTFNERTGVLTGFRLSGVEPARSGWTARGGSTRRGSSPD